MRVALTGTPGTGKTTIAELLRKKGYNVTDLNFLAKEKECIIGYDKERDTKIVDLKKLEKFIEDDNILEGHFAHEFEVNTVIVLRTHPDILKTRLEKKGFSIKKVNENLEAEAMGIITEEAIEKYGNDKVFEVDTTVKEEEVLDKVIVIIEQKEKKYLAGKIDWSMEILKWY